jgi:DivIVA domain-containing protein
MPLTPADIHNTAFSRPPLGKRGYDEAEVDAFLDEVEQEFTRLLTENRALREKVQRTAPSKGRLRADLARLKAELNRAEQHARELESELESARAAAVAEPVRPSGDDRVVALARRTADEHLRDAEREAESVLAAARTKAAQLTSEAGLKASTIDSDARHRHTEAITGLESKRAEALAEIERLTGLAHEHRDSLRDQISQRLQDLFGA